MCTIFSPTTSIYLSNLLQGASIYFLLICKVSYFHRYWFWFYAQKYNWKEVKFSKMSNFETVWLQFFFSNLLQIFTRHYSLQNLSVKFCGRIFRLGVSVTLKTVKKNAVLRAWDQVRSLPFSIFVNKANYCNSRTICPIAVSHPDIFSYH